jgi:hypothetical protein
LSPRARLSPREGWILHPTLDGTLLLWKSGIPVKICIDRDLADFTSHVQRIHDSLEALAGRWVEVGNWSLCSQQLERDEVVARLLPMRAQPTHRLTFTPNTYWDLEGPHDSPSEVAVVCLVPEDESGNGPAYCLAEWIAGEPPDWELVDRRWHFRGKLPERGRLDVERLPSLPLYPSPDP